MPQRVSTIASLSIHGFFSACWIQDGVTGEDLGVKTGIRLVIRAVQSKVRVEKCAMIMCVHREVSHHLPLFTCSIGIPSAN